MSKQAIDEKLVEKLSTGIVTFHYRTKKDGSIRYAVGTTNNQAIPAAKQSKSTNHTTATTVGYFDFAKGDWRSCLKTEIIKIQATVNI